MSGRTFKGFKFEGGSDAETGMPDKPISLVWKKQSSADTAALWFITDSTGQLRTHDDNVTNSNPTSATNSREYDWDGTANDNVTDVWVYDGQISANGNAVNVFAQDPNPRTSDGTAIPLLSHIRSNDSSWPADGYLLLKKNNQGNWVWRDGHGS